MNHIIKNGCYAFTIFLSTACVNLSYAADPAPAPAFNCVMTDQVDDAGRPGDAKAKFTKSTPMIYLICQSDQVKKGQVIKTAWIADDTNNAAPANYKIQEKSVDVTKQPTPDEVYTANFSLSKPDKGWPAGTYHAELSVDNAPVQAVKFSVE